MQVRKPRYSKEEFAKRGDEIYESKIHPQLEADNYGKIVAIDIETGIFEIADDTLTATDKLLEKCPNAQTWVVKIGHRTVHHFGGRTLKSNLSILTFGYTALLLTPLKSQKIIQ